MAILVLKKQPVKQAPPAVQDKALSDFADLIDLVGELQEQAEPIVKQIKVLQAKLTPLAEAQQELQQRIDALELDDDATAIELGGDFRAEVGKKGTSRSIKDKVKLIELLGEELFLQLASVKLSDLDNYLTLPQREEVLETTRTKRSLKVTRRA